jgi:cell division protein FtsB
MKHPYRMLFTRLAIWARRSWSFLWLVAVAGYLVVLAGQAVYRNYQAQQETLALKNQLLQAQQERARLEALLVYYQTDSFKEKELRRALLLKKPGEKVFALPESNAAKRAEEQKAPTVQEKDAVSTQPVWRQWLDYVLNSNSQV